MANDTTQFANEAQDMVRSIYGTMQGLAETQFNTFQKLAGVKANQLNQAFEVANDQLQLVGRVKDPREFASAQADLVKSHGQRYVDSLNEGVDIMVEAWRAYGDRLEQSAGAVINKISTSPKKS